MSLFRWQRFTRSDTPGTVLAKWNNAWDRLALSVNNVTLEQFVPRAGLKLHKRAQQYGRFYLNVSFGQDNWAFAFGGAVMTARHVTEFIAPCDFTMESVYTVAVPKVAPKTFGLAIERLTGGVRPAPGMPLSTTWVTIGAPWGLCSGLGWEVLKDDLIRVTVASSSIDDFDTVSASFWCKAKHARVIA